MHVLTNNKTNRASIFQWKRKAKCPSNEKERSINYRKGPSSKGKQYNFFFIYYYWGVQGNVKGIGGNVMKKQTNENRE